MERKTRFACRCRPFRGLALALFALFGGFATAAQAMLLTLDLRWIADSTTLRDTYHLQEGSIIQVIGFKGEPGAVSFNVDDQFVQYGETDDTTTRAEPYDNTLDPETGEPIWPVTHVPSYGDSGDSRVFLADSTQEGHEILYTGAIQNYGTTNNPYYALYTQITVDSYLYNCVYIRVFGATSIEQGELTASYWGFTNAITLHPEQHYNTDTLAVTNLVAGKLNYFEVIPEPATLGLLGLGGVALAAWRRRRFARPDGDGAARLED